MYSIILTIHVIVCLLVVLIVLIQAGRSSGLSGLTGGGGGDALFSASSQQSGLRRLTVIMAGVFMATSLFLTILSSRRTGRSVLERQYPNLPMTAPAAQAPAPVAEQPAALPAASDKK